VLIENQTSEFPNKYATPTSCPSGNPKGILRNNHGRLKGGFKPAIAVPAKHDHQDDHGTYI
jgi:hypothetical protein